MDKGNGRKLRIFQALGGIVVLLVLAVIGWAIWSSMASPAYTPVTVVVQAQPGGRRGGGAAAAAGTTRPTTQANGRGGRRGNGRGRRGAQQTPLDILVAHKPRNPQLEAWATAWQSNHSTAQPSGDAVTTDADAAALKSLVEKSDLSAIECLHISRLVSNGKDLPAGEAWAAPGVSRAEKELANKDHDDNSAIPIMDALGQAEDPLWDANDHAVVGTLLERITFLLMRFDRSNQWDQRPEWAKIGHGESLYLQGRNDEALVEAQVAEKDWINNHH